MKRIFIAPLIVLTSAAAFAQNADPALDALGQSPVAESELDILSRGADSAFPDIDQKQDRRPVSVTLRALNKITAKYVDLTAAMNETVGFGSLDITPRFCDKRPPEEFPETAAFVEIRDTRAKPASDFKSDIVTPDAPAVEAAAAADFDPVPKLPEDMAFSGWMFASSPALSALEHPVYDVWVIDCKTAAVEN